MVTLARASVKLVGAGQIFSRIVLDACGAVACGDFTASVLFARV
jgi:hypothetical protein